MIRESETNGDHFDPPSDDPGNLPSFEPFSHFLEFFEDESVQVENEEGEMEENMQTQDDEDAMEVESKQTKGNSSISKFAWKQFGKKPKRDRRTQELEHTTFYYKCTTVNCDAKFKYNLLPDGTKEEPILYGTNHNHPPPTKIRLTPESKAALLPLVTVRGLGPARIQNCIITKNIEEGS